MELIILSIALTAALLVAEFAELVAGHRFERTTGSRATDAPAVAVRLASAVAANDPPRTSEALDQAA